MPPGFAQIHREVVGERVGEIRLLGIAAEIRERHHDEREALRGTQGARLLVRLLFGG
jgi:hypothetical protein